MKKFWMFILILFLPISDTQLVKAKDNPKIAVEIVCNYDNDTEAKFIYYIKDAFRKSFMFRLALTDEPRIKIIIQMQDMKILSDNIYGIFYNVVWVSYNKTERGVSWTYISQMLGWGNPGVLKERAEDIIVKTDQIINDYLKH